MTMTPQQNTQNRLKFQLVKCEICGGLVAENARCFCKMPRHIVVRFSDGDELSTRINGTVESIVQHYLTNNAFTNPSDEFRSPGKLIVSVLFTETGETVTACL